MDKSYFEDAHAIVRLVLQKRINHAAQISLTNDILCIAAGLRSASLVDQLFLSENDVSRIQSIFHHSARFSHLDLLSIGDDHVFIIHRQLLLDDIQDYLCGCRSSSTSTTQHPVLQRVFVNVDYHLSQPEIMPANRYKALESFIRKTLLPEIQLRIQTWDQAENRTSPARLIVPPKLSLVTLTGWLLSYPINYVLPGRGRRYTAGGCVTPPQHLSRRASRPHQQHQHQDSGNGGSLHSSVSVSSLTSSDEDDGYVEDDEYEEEEDEDQDNGRNCLANQVLVVTRVHLEATTVATSTATGSNSNHHCLLSFSYPAELAERIRDQNSPSPTSPLSPALSPVTSMAGVDGNEDKGQGRVTTKSGLPCSSDDYDYHKKHAHQQDQCQQRQQQVDISAAGRSFLGVLHSRFQQQSIWKTWEVGQETVTLPVVAM